MKKGEEEEEEEGRGGSLFGNGPTLIQRLCSELHTGAIGPGALAGEGTHFDIISGVGSEAVQDDGGLGRGDEELGGAARAVDVLVLQGVLHHVAVAFCQQQWLPAHLNGGGGGPLGRDALRVAAGHVLVGGHLLDRLLAEPHLVASGQAEGVRGALVDLLGGVVVLPLWELDHRQGVHVFAAEAEAVPLQGAVGDGRGVPLEEGRAHVGGADHESGFVGN